MFSANPRAVPTARLLRALHYDEAQEIASNGAKVLHPRCVLPVRQYKIPLHVYATQAPGLEGTVVSAECRRQRRAGQSDRDQEGNHAGFHGEPGHVASGRISGRCVPGVQAAGLSVDLVSTSETNVTVSLDPTANTLDPAALAEADGGA